MRQIGLSLRAGSQARHGPYFSFTHAVKRRTQSRFLSSGEAAVARRQIERGQQFRGEVDAYWKRCERIARNLKAPDRRVSHPLHNPPACADHHIEYDEFTSLALVLVHDASVYRERLAVVYLREVGDRA